MSGSTRNTHHFKNLVIDGSKLNTGMNSSNRNSILKVKSEAQVPQLEDVRFEDVDLTVVDTGGASGGYSANLLFRLPSTRVQILTTFLDITVNSLGTGISDGVFFASMGVGAATGSPPTGTAINIITASAITVSSGTGHVENIQSTTPISNDATVGTDVYLNITVPDASISATGTINVTGIVRLIYLDVSDGE